MHLIDRVDSPFEDDRGVSVMLDYVITLAIAGVLVSGLLIGVTNVVDSQADRVARGELEVVGQQVAADLESADRLVRASGGGSDTTVTITTDHPTRVAGSTYTIEVTTDEVILESHEQDVEVTIPHNAENVDTSSSAHGGTVEIDYDESDGLEVRNA